MQTDRHRRRAREAASGESASMHQLLRSPTLRNCWCRTHSDGIRSQRVYVHLFLQTGWTGPVARLSHQKIILFPVLSPLLLLCLVLSEWWNICPCSHVCSTIHVSASVVKMFVHLDESGDFISIHLFPTVWHYAQTRPNQTTVSLWILRAINSKQRGITTWEKVKHCKWVVFTTSLIWGCNYVATRELWSHKYLTVRHHSQNVSSMRIMHADRTTTGIPDMPIKPADTRVWFLWCAFPAGLNKCTISECTPIGSGILSAAATRTAGWNVLTDNLLHGIRQMREKHC